MGNILLLGAGFSKNWGAPIASEFFAALIADHEIRGNQQVHALLWANRTNFENALAQLQQNYRQNQRANSEPLLIMQRAMVRVFERMNNIFKGQDFEPHQDRFTVDRSRTVVELLAKFEAIFTLNQDLLLEIHYFDQHHGLTTSRRWNGGSLPGMQPVGQLVDSAAPWSGRVWTPTNQFTVNSGSQPYYKLHGSTNWRDSGENSELMILGGGKGGAIQAIPVLHQYQQIFSEYLVRPGTRLTVIGYGFGDAHINAVLKSAIENSGLKMYVIDPRGAAIAYEARTTKPWQISPGPTEFEGWFQKGLYSASIIPFRRLLIDESVDREVLEQFLAGK